MLAAMVDLATIKVMVVRALRTLAMGLATDFLLVVCYLFGRCTLSWWRWFVTIFVVLVDDGDDVAR